MNTSTKLTAQTVWPILHLKWREGAEREIGLLSINKQCVLFPSTQTRFTALTELKTAMYGRGEVLARAFMGQYLNLNEQFLTELHWRISPLITTTASGNLRIARRMDPRRPEQMKKYGSEGRGAACHILNSIM